MMIKHIEIPTILSYQEGLERQLDLHRAVAEHGAPATVMTLEHRPTITYGKNCSLEDLKQSPEQLQDMGIDLVSSDRGGQITAHMPGQLVVYLLFPLTRMSLSVRDYVCKLEESVIRTLKHWGIDGVRDPHNPGVWVAGEKICSLGVRVSKRVSYHGLAINVCADLSIFDHFVPCGIQGCQLVNVRDLAPEVTFEKFRKSYIDEFMKLF